MRSILKTFLFRGMIFGGFGPIVLGIVYACISSFLGENLALSGSEVCLGIVSIYLLAFVQAGATVFNQIEEWSVMRGLLCHFGVLYVAYVLCYLVNSWIPFDWRVLLIFTAVFVGIYLAVWLTVFFSVRSVGRRCNEQLGRK